MTKLKRCPFCKSELYYAAEWNSGNHLHCRNNECVIECSFDSFNEIEKAINTRPIEDELQAELIKAWKPHCCFEEPITCEGVKDALAEIARLKELIRECAGCFRRKEERKP